MKHHAVTKDNGQLTYGYDYRRQGYYCRKHDFFGALIFDIGIIVTEPHPDQPNKETFDNNELLAVMNEEVGYEALPDEHISNIVLNLPI